MSLKYGEPCPQVELRLDPFHTWANSAGDRGVQFFRTQGGGYRVRFPGAADFLIPTVHAPVVCMPVPDVPLGALEHIFLNQILPLVNSRRGRITLHASAVRLDSGCIAFMGRAGLGKSTLAATLATTGHPLVCDDGLEVLYSRGHWQVTPQRTSVRLNPDSFEHLFGRRELRSAERVTRKYVAADLLPRHREGQLPITALYVVGDEGVDAATFRRIDAPDALIELVRHSFILDPADSTVVARQFERFTDFVAQVPCWQLDYPREWDRLADVCSDLIRHARSASCERLHVVSPLS